IEMVNLTRLDCTLGSATSMRNGLTRAIHHAQHRKAFGAYLIDQPLMRNVLADLAVEAEAATMLAMRMAGATDRAVRGDERETLLRRIGLAIALLLGGFGTAAAVLFVLVLAFGASGTGLHLVSESRMAQWGAALSQSLSDRGIPECRDPYGQEAVQTLASRIAPVLPNLGQTQPQITALNDPRFGVLGLPGGHVVLFQGSVEVTRSADELAGLLAVGLAESDRALPAQRLSERHGIDFLWPLLRGDWDNPVLGLESYLGALEPAPLEDIVTDALAIAALSQAGLRARGVSLVMDSSVAARVGQASASPGSESWALRGIPAYFSLHPLTEERRSRLRQAPRGGDKAMTDLDWAAFKILCG
ncbi:MAG: acyl-CoA dehydrogenase family protein, partial [Rhodospirillaceae bacterium]